MTRAKLQAVGLSVGATALTAVTSDTTVRRSAVLTLFGHRPPLLGRPWEHRESLRSDRPEYRGVVLTDFVDRVGDPVAMLAPDGSPHRAEALLAEALRVLAGAAVGRGEMPALITVAYPVQWSRAATEALRRALRRVPEFSHRRVRLVPDATAALTALQRQPGLPVHGVVAVCDLGGSGTTLTLVDAEHGYAPIGEPVRHHDFGGDLVDQTLLTHVVGELARAGAVDVTSTSAIGALSALRGQCRRAKETLSARAVAALAAELPDYRGEVRVTRAELDDLIHGPLAGLVDGIRDMLQRNGIAPANLSAVATVGGGASIAAVTTMLSQELRVPVLTPPSPEIAAATGAALTALGAVADDSETAMAPTRRPSAGVPPRGAVSQDAPAEALGPPPAEALGPPPAEAAEPPRAEPALAWSEVDEDPEPQFSGLELAPGAAAAGAEGVTGAARPLVEFAAPAELAEPEPVRWYRRPVGATVAAAVVLLAAAGGIGVVLTRDSQDAPVSTPAPSVSETAQPGPPAAEVAAPAQIPDASPEPR
ncbi:Hsp70 family protein [Mycolicibacterium palauense]|uniref:Hsp70 family protein n=1 Tax=Mycolicibacterium palauense TaxID=2034511 RepID=UPI000BFEEC64|nr:Hsp70 family protein [Mycolicibacterium palauense]